MERLTRYGLPVELTNQAKDGLVAYIVAEIAIQVAACEMAQQMRGRDSPVDQHLEHATRVIMAGPSGARETWLHRDSIQTAWRVYAHLKQLGLIDDRPNKTAEAHAHD